MYHYNYPASPSLHSKMVSQHFKAFVNVFSMKHTIWSLINREPANRAIMWLIICMWKWSSALVWLLNGGDCVIVCCYECDALRFAVISDAVISMCLSSPVSRSPSLHPMLLRAVCCCWALLLPHCTHQEDILDVQLQRNLEYLDQQVGGSIQQPQLRFNADSILALFRNLVSYSTKQHFKHEKHINYD